MARHSTSFIPTFVALGVSLAVHALVGAALVPWVHRESELKSAPEPRSAVLILSEEDVEKLFSNSKKPNHSEKLVKKEESPKKEPQKPKETPHKGQIVEIPPPMSDSVPDAAKYLAEFNSKVEHEQRSRDHNAPTQQMVASEKTLISHGRDEHGTLDSQNRTKHSTSEQPQAAQPQTQSEKSTPNQRAQESQNAQNQTNQHSSRELGHGPFSAAQVQKERQALAASMASAPPADVRGLLPTLGPRDMAAHFGSQDYLEDVDEGDQTFLNAREYKHAWFFNRIKREVAQHWNGAAEHRRNDPFGKVYGVRDRVTVLKVTLTPDGELYHVEVEKDCGIAYLDEAAIQAFRQAAPFPNPPKALIENGFITFSFGFHLEISSGSLNIFRRPL